MKKVVKLNEFLSCCIQLVEGSAKVIHEVRKIKNFSMSKGAADVFTEADVHIQNTVKWNLE
jgi:hypothetical protein